MASKRTKITDIEKHYILTNPENLNDKDLANKVGCQLKVVQNLRTPATEKPVVVEPKKEETAEKTVANNTTQVYDGPTAGKLMGRNEKYGVVIMSPAASELADEAAKINREKNKGSSKYKTSDVIHVLKK